MCIRDRTITVPIYLVIGMGYLAVRRGMFGGVELRALGKFCLLYTSDAADERSSVDLGGRRIIKKKHAPTLAASWSGTSVGLATTHCVV